MDWIGHWLALDVVWKLAAGVGMGWIVGRVLGWLTFKVRESGRIAKTGDGLVALGFTCVAYAETELIHGYDFVAVFVAVLTLRSVERKSSFHGELHDFGEQIECMVMMVLLVCFGSIVAEGSLLQHVDWRVAVVAVATLLVVRPLAGWISLLGCGHPVAEKVIVSVFGIRGLDSIYYLAYATGKAKFENVETVWATVLVIILASTVIHCMAVTPVIRWIDRRRDVDSMKPAGSDV